MALRVKEFKAPTDIPVKVWSDDFIGSTFIQKEWTPVREDQWKAAYSQGCISKDMAVKGFDAETTLAVVKHEEKIYEEKVMDAMRQLIDEGDPDKLDGTGRPKVEFIGEIVGRHPTAKLRNQLYNHVIKR